MGVTNPKLAKSGRKLKKAKHCTIPKTLNKKKRKDAYGKGTELKVNSGKGKSHNGEYVKRCTKPSLGSLKFVFSRKRKDEQIGCEMLNSMCTFGELEPKMSSQPPKTQAIHYKPKRSI